MFPRLRFGLVWAVHGPSEKRLPKVAARKSRRPLADSSRFFRAGQHVEKRRTLLGVFFATRR